METGILAAVGVNKTNNDIDVEVIQKLLNRVPVGLGGPEPRLAEDGDCGPLTIAAIRKFQRKALGFDDGVVDPFKNTHKKLIEIAGSSEAVPMRIELAERYLPRVQPMIVNAATVLETLRLNPEAPGPTADRTREALKVHFMPDDQFTKEGQVGRVKQRFDSIRVNIDHRNLYWRDATIKRAKADLKLSKTVNIPPIYISTETRAAIVFTPNYKPLDDDGLGYGPQMLAYTLIVGLAKFACGHHLNKPLLHSDTPGYPGMSYWEAVDNPAAFGGFAFQIHMGFAVPLGDTTRKM